MLNNFSRLFLIIFFIAATVAAAVAQSDASDRDPNHKEDVPKGIQETLAKQRINREKKDFAELLKRGDEAIKLSDELEKSYVKNNMFSTDDQKKLDRLEKVVKKIRSELGANDDDDQAVEKPLSLLNALKILQTNTVQLVDELKKNSRYSISVVAVESSNALLSLVRFLRFRKN